MQSMFVFASKFCKALFGLLTCFIGGSIVAWCLYNLCIHRFPEYTGPSNIFSLLIGGFGVGPALFTVGKFWVCSALKK